MSRGIKWKICVEDVAEYPESIDGKAFFDKVVSLWKEYPNAISNRLTAVIEVEHGSSLWDEVIGMFESVYKFNPTEKYELGIMKFIPRDNMKMKFSENAFEVSFYEEECLVRLYPVVLDGGRHPHFESPYAMACRLPSETQIQFQILRSIDTPDEHFEFLKVFGFKTAFTWLKSIDLSKITRKTNSLIDKESYIRTYRNIRETFGRPICREWTENSDPKKAVFEDCGITSYIHELVQSDVLPKPRKYVDIGCGNGLLVHLLNKCGYNGYGVDVRKRNVWHSMFKDDDLRESAVDPQIIVQDQPHFDADVDLLIGNHSDELTPWIPVMAAKLNANFFLIPCCPFDFFGKYRNNGSHLGPKRMVSQYESFFEWTVTVAERLGFQISLDRLAIPSTKRLCIVGRVPEAGLCPNIDASIHLMTGGQRFAPRQQAITMSNCLHIPVDVRHKIAMKLFNFILNESEDTRDGWRCGAEVPLHELAAILTDEEKKLMKDQDGGLQTFMKNNHQIFHVGVTSKSIKVFKATARLRDFRQPIHKSKKKERISKWKAKTKKPPTMISPCWMSLYHPDGCPVGPEACRYAH